MSVITESPSPEELDDTWIELIVNGHAVKTEAFEALQTLADVDGRHDTDANECAACGHVFGTGDACPSCASKQFRASRAYRDDLVATLRKDCGLPEMSGRTALAIYDRIVAVCESKKNGNGIASESPTGLESTPVTSPPAESEPG